MAYHILRRRKHRGFEGQEVREPKDKGYLKYLFELNDFGFFDWLQRLLGVHIHSTSFTLGDAFRAELTRYKQAVLRHTP
ncbi:MAG: hypothetical protein V3T58_08145 [Candidatus Hydrothermarchaeales archaeon]